MVRTVLVDASRKVQEAHTDQIASGSMVLRRARGYERLDRAGQIGQGITNGNQPLFTPHGSFSHAPQTRQGIDLCPPAPCCSERLQDEKSPGTISSQK